ncbi:MULTISPECIES: hypothetical protein [unclassified Rhizobium]|uniref:hypothetical protein n=1 Tax=unclassified Rhizobium TaxID=2613769 RepID=UPI001673FC48|nr:MULTISPECIES: hypothetical protein [unclassified Rhizobium]
MDDEIPHFRWIVSKEGIAELARSHAAPNVSLELHFRPSRSASAPFQILAS